MTATGLRLVVVPGAPTLIPHLHTLQVAWLAQLQEPEHRHIRRAVVLIHQQSSRLSFHKHHNKVKEEVLVADTFLTPIFMANLVHSNVLRRHHPLTIQCVQTA